MEDDNMEYKSVPNIISSKDLDYLSDMFNWHYGAYKNTVNMIDMINNEEISSLISKASDLFYSNMNNILSILSNGVNNG